MSWVDFRAELKSKLTPQLCVAVKRLRCEEQNTWRGLSDRIFDEEPSKAIDAYRSMRGHQPLGQYLCELCSELENEDWD